jgi:hypothetical protein
MKKLAMVMAVLLAIGRADAHPVGSWRRIGGSISVVRITLVHPLAMLGAALVLDENPV